MALPNFSLTQKELKQFLHYCPETGIFTWIAAPENEVDHINHVRNDNRWINLRKVNTTENSKNATLSLRNTSGTTGVSWDKSTSKWHSYISYKGKRIHLGRFGNREDAKIARNKSNIKFGYHPNHGISVSKCALTA